MQVLYFRPGHPAELAGSAAPDESGCFYWLDVERSETDWHESAQRWLGMRLHDRHVRDTLNDTHPPYYDGTEDYDLLVVRAVRPDCPAEAPATQPVALIVATHAVVSVRPPGDPVFAKLHQRFLGLQRHAPTSPAMLLYLLLDQVTDALLARRDLTAEVVSRWQERLFDREESFIDWKALMHLHGHLRRLEVVTESQLDALDKWRDQTSLSVDSSLGVRFNDLQEHLRRVYNDAVVVQHDIDALVEIYFSANTQRTNDTLRILTVVSAIFLPLNLIAGLFGMNFKHMPLLAGTYGPWIVTGVMVAIVGGLVLWFRRRHWL